MNIQTIQFFFLLYTKSGYFRRSNYALGKLLRSPLDRHVEKPQGFKRLRKYDRRAYNIPFSYPYYCYFCDIILINGNS